MQIIDLILTLVEIFMAVGLFWLAGFATKVLNSKWKLCYLTPLILVFLLLAIGGFEISMLPAYIGGCIALLGFFMEKESARKMAAILLGACAFLCTATTDYYEGYREIDYVGNFEKAYSTMEAHYDMTEYKNIDWEMLHETYLAKIKEAKKQHSPELYHIAMLQFCAQFHDGHVKYVSDGEAYDKACEILAGNDYGLSIMQLEDGSYVAVNVEEKGAVSSAGIHNGTTLLTWNNEPIKALCEQVDTSLLGGVPLLENEDFYRPILAAGMGDETVSITFLDDEGKEQSVEVSSLGSYWDRLKDTLEIVDQGVNISNLAFKEVNNNTYVLRIKEMQYDSESYENGDHSAMKEELRSQLIELKDKNVEHLIIDIRGNGGGSPHMIMAIASLLVPEGEYKYSYEGVFDKKTASYVKEANGNYKVGLPLEFTGENVWENRKITILVNAQSISAADHFTYLMKSMDLENVEIVGFTKTNASGQAVSGFVLDGGMVTYSCVPTLNQDGTILVDGNANREGGIELDEKIPITEDVIKTLFDDKEDYILNYVITK